MSDQPQGQDWWRGMDGKWYPPMAAAPTATPPAATSPQVDAPKAKRPTWLIGIGAVLLLWGCGIVVDKVNGDSSPSSDRSYSFSDSGGSDAPIVNPRPTIEYCWSGTTDVGVSITMQNGLGNVEQATGKANNQCITAGPIRSGSFVYVSVQISGHGDIACSIKADGTEIETARSSGDYVLATCSGESP